MKTTAEKMLQRMKRRGRAWCFSDSDFTDLGQSGAIRQCLSRLEQEASIRRVLRGLYDRPRYDSFLAVELSPDSEQVARALARKFGWSIHITGAAAANLLGLSQQVPTQNAFLSSGPNRLYRINGQELHFQHANPKDFCLQHKESVLLVQALKSLGKKRMNENIFDAIKKRFSFDQIQIIFEDTYHITGWIREAIASTRERYA